MGCPAPGPPALSLPPRAASGPLPGPCSPTRYPDSPTAHATSSRQEPATLSGQRPCYQGHVTLQPLPPSAGRGFRPSGALPPACFLWRIGHAPRGSTLSVPRGSTLSPPRGWATGGGTGGGRSFRRAARVLSQSGLLETEFTEGA